MGGVLGKVGHRRPRPDEGGLVAHDVDAVEQFGPVRGVADVEHVQTVDLRTDAVGLRQERVHEQDLVASGVELAPDRTPDEPGRTGEQHPHEWSPDAGWSGTPPPCQRSVSSP